LIKEPENEVAHRFEIIDNKNILYGRRDLHLRVFFKRMRRNGFKMIVSPPYIIIKIYIK
jgi:hypothetical protein